MSWAGDVTGSQGREDAYVGIQMGGESKGLVRQERGLERQRGSSGIAEEAL